MQFLLIARVVEGVSMEQVLPHVKDEAAKVWEEYTADIAKGELALVRTGSRR